MRLISSRHSVQVSGDRRQGRPRIVLSLAIAVALLSVMLALHQYGRELLMQPDQVVVNEIARTVYANTAAFNAKNIDAYMTTLCENIPEYDLTRAAVEHLYLSYDLRVQIEIGAVYVRSPTRAEVDFVMTAYRLGFPSRDLEGTYFLYQDAGAWRICAQTTREPES